MFQKVNNVGRRQRLHPVARMNKAMLNVCACLVKGHQVLAYLQMVSLGLSLVIVCHRSSLAPPLCSSRHGSSWFFGSFVPSLRGTSKTFIKMGPFPLD
jgi:hypothetical protein